ENSYSTGDISGNTDIGGIAGNIYNNSKIENCAALNINIQGISDIGRIAGYADNSSTLSNNIAWDGIAGWGHIGADDLDGESISKESINADGTLGNRFTSPVWTTQNGKLPGLFGNTVTMPPHLQLPGMVYITTTTLPDGTVGTPYSATLTADGDTPITWTIETGNLPTGLTLNASTGAISGTPTAEGTFTFAVKAANNVGSDTAELEIVIGSVGIVETPLMASLRVFPNPTRGEIIVENGELKIENVEIFDVMGRKQKIIFNFQLSTFNLTDLPSGIYFLKITTETGVITKKVIKT
ncbi:MAG: T9SS type A sorting domain-containing protein, partial [Bacteroidales bacterium]|nr:T9SS type A sorting domain-containing protein [Bacteroidales bacterium]